MATIASLEAEILRLRGVATEVPKKIAAAEAQIRDLTRRAARAAHDAKVAAKAKTDQAGLVAQAAAQAVAILTKPVKAKKGKA